jgi:polysaccharide export outer membrane protein
MKRHDLYITLVAFGVVLAASQDACAQDAAPAGSVGSALMQATPSQGAPTTGPNAQGLQPQLQQAPQAQHQPQQQQLQQLQSQQQQQQTAPPQQPGQPEIGDTDRNEFQEFIAQTVGQRLPLYGLSLFQRAPSTFAPVDNVPVTPDYVLGPGDELHIRAWGQMDIDIRATVDRDGTISIPRVATLAVAGIPYKDITSTVRTALSRNFRNFELLVTMGQLRSVQIFVVGQARRPGAYTVSSLSTLVNAIFAAGGPSSRGTMRAIQLKRGNQVITEFDLYDLLLRGDKSRDARLLPGDVIHFPPVGPLAAAYGGVQNPAIYELKGAAVIATLIEYAGGLTNTAQLRRASIERIENREARIVDQFALDASGMARTVKDADLLSVFSVSPKYDNAVTLRGNVAAPLRYPYVKGMRIRDLIPEKEALVSPDYYLRKNLTVRIESVRQSTLATAVRQLGDEINWGYAVIERQNDADLSATLIPFDLGKAILEGDPGNNLALKPGDVVTVFSKSDLAAAVDTRPVVVRLEGEFNHSGLYQARPGETLRQLVRRAGGVTAKGYFFGAQFMRESTRREQEERLRQAIDQLEQDAQRAAIGRAQSAASAEDAISLKQEAEAQRALLARLRAFRPNGRIVLDIPPNGTIADLPELELEDGDRLVIGQRPSMVSVFGTVYTEASFLYRPDKTVNDYLTQAGGARKEADTESMFMMRADGSVVSRRRSGFLVGSLGGISPMPGDTIVVPEDLQRTTRTKDFKDWTQILYQFGLGAAAIKVLKN